jgi:hypothetical protein
MITATAATYTTDLIRGTGLINETIILASVYKPGMTKRQLLDLVMSENVLSTATQSRAQHIVYYFFQRYVKQGIDVPGRLTYLRSKHVTIEGLGQIMLIYTCRASALLSDFIRYVYHERTRRGLSSFDHMEARNFIEEALTDGKVEKPWSAATKLSLAEHMGATLIDFRLIDRTKKILPFFIQDLTANYLLHDMHFQGVADNDLPDASEWALFGLRRYDVLRIMERLAAQGHFIFQSSGELVRIAWHYSTMNDCLTGITRYA